MTTKTKTKTRLGWKLLRVRQDKTLGSLFINKSQVLVRGVWLESAPHKTPGYAFRPGRHAMVKREAPHLSTVGRVWCRVELLGVEEYERPEAQGGMWLLAKQMRIIRVYW